ncbi:hypothetical protein EHZ19_06735 [Paraburkholderia bannensis]|nr:hypothetical protein [Paraburkholderia bannensis]RQM49332.1 hypothetical protein EHZ19_06735 [Paraburkholderia bannensis]
MPVPTKSIANSARRATRTMSRTSPKAAKNIADLLRAADQNSGYGVKVIVFRDPATLPTARALIEKHVLDGKPIADRSMPRMTSLTSLYGGASTHEFAMARILDDAINGPAPADERHRFESVGFVREIDGAVVEGAYIVLSKAERGGCVTVAQSLTKKQHEGFKEVLLRLDVQAKDEEVVVFLFLICLDGRPESWLLNYCSDVFVVDTYEPEPDASFGFSVSAMKLEQSHTIGVGKVACEVTTTTANRIRYRWGDFVAATLEERAMLYLNHEGLSWRRISKLFGVDDHVKVWRKLKDIARRVTVQPPTGWREKYFDCLGLDPGEEDGSSEGSEEDTPPSDDDAEQWEDELPPKRPRRRIV